MLICSSRFYKSRVGCRISFEVSVTSKQPQLKYLLTRFIYVYDLVVPSTFKYYLESGIKHIAVLSQLQQQSVKKLSICCNHQLSESPRDVIDDVIYYNTNIIRQIQDNLHIIT